MNVYITHDFERHLVYIPDGYTGSMEKLRDDFLDWVGEQPECILNGGICFGHETFLRYLNEVLLKEVNEKAYLVHGVSGNKHIPKIDF